MFAGETSYEAMMEKVRYHVSMLEDCYYEARTNGAGRLLRDGRYDLSNPEDIERFATNVASAHGMWVAAKTYFEVVLAHPHLQPADNNLIQNTIQTLFADLEAAGVELPIEEPNEFDEEFEEEEQQPIQ